MGFPGWSLREEANYLISRWYMFVLVFLIGGGLGWGTAFVFPTDYESTAPLFVAFNSDAIFTTPDDYKNEQFGEVEFLILSDPLLDKVLVELRQKNSFWQDLNHQTLRKKLSLRWRNAGRWDLVAQDRDPARAGELAVVWRDSSFQLILEALSHSQSFYQLNLEMQAVSRALGEVVQEQVRLQAIETIVQSWLNQPDNVPFSERDRFEWQAFAQAALFPTDFPAAGAPRQEYITWAETWLTMLEAEKEILTNQEQGLRAQLGNLAESWLAEKSASEGLSTFLVVQSIESPVETHAIREPGLSAIVGGVIGVVGLFLFRLGRAARNEVEDA